MIKLYNNEGAIYAHNTETGQYTDLIEVQNRIKDADFIRFVNGLDWNNIPQPEDMDYTLADLEENTLIATIDNNEITMYDPSGCYGKDILRPYFGDHVDDSYFDGVFTTNL